ncbi:MAG: hypothetical protein ACN4GW_16335 [Desulforhopalus sp.]
MKKLLLSLSLSAVMLCGAAQNAFAARKTQTIGMVKEPAKLNAVLVPGGFGASGCLPSLAKA